LALRSSARHEGGFVLAFVGQGLFPAVGGVLGGADGGQGDPDDRRAGLGVAGDQDQHRQGQHEQQARAAGGDIGVGDRRHQLGAQVSGLVGDEPGRGIGGLA
jgi:hypothetical protein